MNQNVNKISISFECVYSNELYCDFLFYNVDFIGKMEIKRKIPMQSILFEKL